MKLLISVAFLIVIAVSCSPVSLNKSSGTSFEASVKPEQPDYADLYYWAAHPGKWDPSDSVPKPFRKDYWKDTTVDVFFIHPTSYLDPEASASNGSFNDARLNEKTDNESILFQASAFNHYRVFAPRYRQAHIRSYYPGPNDTAMALAAFELAYQDVKAAFLYYLNHENGGRPIILASHSQGSTHAIRLMKELFDGKPLQKQLVAAYAIGMYMPVNSFTSLPVCAEPTQTGCVIGWRTFRQDYVPPFVEKEPLKSIVVNPLSWKTDTGFVDRKQNKSTILLKFNMVHKSVADAWIQGSVLWTRHPNFFGSSFYKTSNYHIADINLYYGSIRKNVEDRVRGWKNF
jgi:hypothetical protein